VICDLEFGILLFVFLIALNRIEATIISKRIRSKNHLEKREMMKEISFWMSSRVWGTTKKDRVLLLGEFWP
jgi:hypothetical protein